jgi:putative polyketide hydroxylase
VVGGPDLADAKGRFLEAYGISPSGAVVVRPDGFVGWRAVDAGGTPEEIFPQVLRSLLCREDGNP